ncbi:antimicrobial response protein [Lithospermum erythrorhizon]|uniref:Antimicrobial response protein n=1 Tax=Lithospermum erythrorhizon TaxID=34254 RepID=A0AAV3Q471_LITER
MEYPFSFLKKQGDYYSNIANGALVNDHFPSLEHGLRFLDKLAKASINDNLRNSIVTVLMKAGNIIIHQSYESRDGSLTTTLHHSYSNLRGMMMNVFKEPRTSEYEAIFPNFSPDLRSLMDTNGLLLEIIEVLFSPNCKADKLTGLMNDLQRLTKILTYLKPLFTCICIYPKSYKTSKDKDVLKPLVSVLELATWPVYSSLVGILDEELEHRVKSNLSKLVEETDITKIYLTALRTSSCSRIIFSENHPLQSEFCLLENLINLFSIEANSTYEGNVKMYVELTNFRTFLADLDEILLLKKLPYFQASIEDMIGKVIPMAYTYFEETKLNDEMAQKLNSTVSDVLHRIRQIKSEAQDLKLYHYPTTKGAAYLQFFWGYLGELLKSEHMLIPKNEIATFYLDIYLLINFLSTARENVNKWFGLWRQVLDLAYEADSLINRYLSSPSESLVSSLSSIVEQVKLIRKKVVTHYPVDIHEDVDAVEYLTTQTVPLRVEGVSKVPTFQEATQDVASTSSTVSGDASQVNDIVVGFKKHVNTVTEYLLGGEKDLDVISIVGMAGLGKTTLASKLFNNSLVEHHFDRQAWITISQIYKTRELLLKIIDQVNPSADEIRNLDDQSLADILCRSLKKCKYFVVMDDMWDTGLWDFLKRYFPDDRQGSRIIITTRYETVAFETKSKLHPLCELTDDESWELLQKRLPKDLPKHFQILGNELALDCKGLPLSIVILAGLLSDVGKSESKWYKIAKRVTSHILADPQSKCKAILELSYNHLPDPLQSCFLYLGTFPRDEEIVVSELTRQWIGEGYVQGGESDSLEEVAEKYVVDLSRRSLLVPAKFRSDGGIKTCLLNDLVRDFCLDKGKENKNDYSSFHQMPILVVFDLLPDMNQELGDYELLRILKVLHISDGSDGSSPLLLIPSFPKMCNLQFLFLKTSSSRVQIPDFMWDMKKLRHVKLDPTASFQVDEQRLQNSSNLSENLRYLSRAIVDAGDSLWLEKLPKLQRLSCLISVGTGIFHLNVSQLISLTVVGCAPAWTLSRLHFPQSLRKLTLKSINLPLEAMSEIGSKLCNLHVLKLYHCWKPKSIVPWRVKDEDFPSLKILKLRDVGLEDWDASENAFSCLEKLWLEDCHTFDSIPLCFGDLPKLHFITLKNCSDDLHASAKEIEEVQLEAQNNEFNVQVYPKSKPSK